MRHRSRLVLYRFPVLLCLFLGACHDSGCVPNRVVRRPHALALPCHLVEFAASDRDALLDQSKP